MKKWLDQYQYAGQVPISDNLRYQKPIVSDFIIDPLSGGYVHDPARAAALLNQPTNPGTISKTKDRSVGKQIYNVATHPMTSAQQLVNKQPVTGLGPQNPYDLAFDVFPTMMAARQLPEIPGNLQRGEYLQAGLNAATAIPFLPKIPRGLPRVLSEGQPYEGAPHIYEDMVPVNGRYQPRTVITDAGVKNEILGLEATPVIPLNQMEYPVTPNKFLYGPHNTFGKMEQGTDRYRGMPPGTSTYTSSGDQILSQNSTGVKSIDFSNWMSDLYKNYFVDNSIKGSSGTTHNLEVMNQAHPNYEVKKSIIISDQADPNKEFTFDITKKPNEYPIINHLGFFNEDVNSADDQLKLFMKGLENMQVHLPTTGSTSIYSQPLMNLSLARMLRTPGRIDIANNGQKFLNNFLKKGNANQIAETPAQQIINQFPRIQKTYDVLSNNAGVKFNMNPVILHNNNKINLNNLQSLLHLDPLGTNTQIIVPDYTITKHFNNGGPIITNRGQWDYPGQTTIIPSNNITMQGVPYPVMGVDNTGHTKMMHPGMNYTFPGQYVTEYPMMQGGGQMIKRADGSYSRRGLWDNIRAAAGSGKKPTAQMLEQERKIRNKYQEGGVIVNAGGEKHRIYVKSTNRGEGDKGHIMVNHPTMDKGEWDTIDLTKKAGATTIAQGVAATKKWHRENPYKKQEGGDVYWRTGQPMVNDPSMDAISKVLLYRNQDKNFMQRAAGLGYQRGIPTRYINGQDPNSNNTSSLLMSSGDNIVFPTIIQTAPQQLSYQPNQYQEYIETPSWDIADYFATKGYKRAANDMYGMEYKNGGYVVRRSHDRKGKTHVVIGPDGTKKYFGDPNMGERSNSKYGKEAFYARHKHNLAKNPYFRAYARATWENGGQTMAIGGQTMMNPVTKKDNRNWLEFLKN
jgi:hypothetical protein